MQFSVLGPLRAWRNGREVELGPPQRRAILALLLVRAGAPVDRTQMVDVLWPTQPPKSAFNVIHRHMGALRRLLGSPPQQSGAEVISSGVGSYRLPLDTDALDLLRFRTLTEQGQRAYDNGTHEVAVDLLTRALGMRQGETAGGIALEARSHPAFTAVEREYMDVLKKTADIALAHGAADLVLAALRESAETNPLEEGVQARLITALAQTGQRAEGLRTYRDVEHRLAEQMDVEPGPELLAAREVLRAPATAGRQRHEPAEAPHRRLPPERGGAPANPAIGGTRPSQLPFSSGIFTGRTEEMASLTGLVPGPDDAVSGIVVSGMAGVGKTTLALRLARQAADRFPDGQLYTDLRGFSADGEAVSPTEVLRIFLHALGIPPRYVPSAHEERAGLYRSLLAGRRVLILLDNARDAQQVRPLLPAATGSMVVITSRNRLDGLVAVEGMHHLSLGPFSIPEAREAVIQRIGAARAAREPEALDTIIRECGQLPLALSVVAARILTGRDLKLSAVAKDLAEGRRLNAFSLGDPATDLRTVFSWSVDALSPAARGLFFLLADFAHPHVTPEAAASAMALPLHATEVLLDELTRAHLVVRERHHHIALHDLMHALAVECTDRHGDEAARHAARHRVVYHQLHTARRAATQLAPHSVESLGIPAPPPGTTVRDLPDRSQAAAWLDDELPVLLALVEKADTWGLPELAWRLGQTVAHHLDRRGQWRTQLTVQRAALTAAGHADSALGRAHALRALGFAHGRLGESAAAHSLLGEALALFEELGLPDNQARTHRLLAFCANNEGYHTRALRHYERAFALYHATGTVSGQASVLNEQGWTEILLGHHQQALTLCREAIELHEGIRDANGAAAAWDSLGCAQHGLGRYAEAAESFERSLALYRAISDRTLEADTLIHLGDTHAARGARTEAEAAWREALALLSRLNHPDEEGVLRRLGEEAG
ncbi:AfsR/SARP family transcriptional regulator [Streptomyces sp. NPDC050560]|uniref:AfsR/SARP family transcriptional regulator n=1 Tax=Streptomyces sp. NPDC050560 TaxID=3365630 RepID=UPI00378E3475